ncbi:MAG: hypothetical protein RLZZ324_866 [Candidatus Parcubacteria bacterium]|jgi:thymidylate kinase
MKNVCFLFGINGVGKSALAQAIAASIVGTAVISASDCLRAELGGLSRERLEALDPAVKHEAKRRSLLRMFDACKSARFVLCDSHLVVPIRSDASLRYERMWDDAFAQHAFAAIHVIAPTEIVVQRRKSDAEQGVRTRRVDPREITADARAATAEFAAVFQDHPRAHTVTNIGPIEHVASRIIQAMS